MVCIILIGLQSTSHTLPTSVIVSGGYVFNTEAHPIDAAALYCCSGNKYRDDMELDQLQASNNILRTLSATSMDDDTDRYFEENSSFSTGANTGE